jgi:hypothetical protein
MIKLGNIKRARDFSQAQLIGGIGSYPDTIAGTALLE